MTPPPRRRIAGTAAAVPAVTAHRVTPKGLSPPPPAPAPPPGGNVGAPHPRPPPRSLGDPPRPPPAGLIDVRNGDRRPGIRQGDGRRTPNAGAASGNQSHFALEVLHFPVLLALAACACGCPQREPGRVHVLHP